MLIFQNQGFDRLSEVPKIREAIIVSADGCFELVDLKTVWKQQRKDGLGLILAH